MPIINPTAPTHPERFGYRIPGLPFVGENKLTSKMLELEKRAIEYANKCGLAWAEVLTSVTGHKADMWKDGLPEALASILNGMDSHAADAAAIGYLRKRGYQITDKAEGY